MRYVRFILAVWLSFLGPVVAHAAEPADCHLVRFADIGWTDITANTALVSRILQGIGYGTNTQVLSVPVTYVSLKNKDIDVFLGNWMPTMQADRAPYEAAHSIDILGPNLVGARYTLAVSQATYDAGLHDFADIAKFHDALGGKIYGIEPGNDGNRVVLSLIKAGKFGLGDFDLVESSEQGMLAQLERAIRRHQMIVFLGWEPHPMNLKFAIKYLDDKTNSFGPNDGSAEIFTNVRAGYLQECPNVARFLHQLHFNLPMEDELMSAVLNGGEDASVAGETWLKAHPDIWKLWLEGVVSTDGRPAAAALAENLAH